jgi:hypothetical protein
MLTYTKVPISKGPPYYMVMAGSNHIGTIDQCEDGFCHFYPLPKGGFWESAILKDIAHKLDALNEAWSQRLNEEFDKLKGQPKL